MPTLPPIPSWDGLHPLVVHFPAALLLVAPLFIALGVLLPRWRACSLPCALLLMGLGTAGTYFAVPTGEAAAKLADRTPEISAQIESHEELAENSRIAFTVLTLLFAILVVVPKLLKTELKGIFGLAALLLFLALYAAGMVLLANTAHAGGRLVHEFGVHAMM